MSILASQAISAITYFIPGLCRPSIIRSLYAAHLKNSLDEKIRAYIKVAKELYQQGCPYSARGVLFHARKLLPIRVNRATIGYLCKIAKVQILINPKGFSTELRDASHLEEQVSIRSRFPDTLEVLGASHAIAAYKIAKRYWEQGNRDRTKGRLHVALACAKREPNPLKAIQALLRIAKLQKKVFEGTENAKEALSEATLRIVKLPHSTERVKCEVAIAMECVSINLTVAKKILQLAKSEVHQLQESSFPQKKETQQLVDFTINAFNLLK